MEETCLVVHIFTFFIHFFYEGAGIDVLLETSIFLFRGNQFSKTLLSIVINFSELALAT